MFLELGEDSVPSVTFMPTNSIMYNTYEAENDETTDVSSALDIGFLKGTFITLMYSKKLSI